MLLLRWVKRSDEGEEGGEGHEGGEVEEKQNLSGGVDLAPRTGPKLDRPPAPFLKEVCGK